MTIIISVETAQRHTVVVYPSGTVGVDVSNHVVDLFLCQVVSQALQDPS